MMRVCRRGDGGGRSCKGWRLRGGARWDKSGTSVEWWYWSTLLGILVGVGWFVDPMVVASVVVAVLVVVGGDDDGGEGVCARGGVIGVIVLGGNNDSATL